MSDPRQAFQRARNSSQPPGEPEPGKERCGVSAIGFKVTCDLGPGHVKTADDRHVGTSETESTQRTSDYEYTTVIRETVRWAPMSWEIPKQQAEVPGGQ